MTYTSHSISVPSAHFDLPATVFVPQRAADASGEVDASANGATNATISTQGTTRRPALVVLHDHFGIDEFTTQSAQRLADWGYITLVPDLFAEAGNPPDTSSETSILTFTLSLFDSRLVEHVLAAVNWLTEQDEVDEERLGVVGWGWGGAYALMAAAHDARIRVAANIGGHLTYPVLTPQKPGSPLNFVGNIEGVLFAAFAGQDPLSPSIEVERLIRQLTDHDRRGDVKIYDAPARFWHDESLPQTATLWRRLENVLRDALAAPEDFEMDYPNEESRIHA